jgi:hypothetical protein
MPKQGMRVLREQTEQFIGENPTSLVLTRSTRTEDGAGGWVNGAPTPLPAQRVRLVPQSASPGVERRTVSGEVVRPDLRIVGMPEFNVAVGDTFTWNTIRMEVVWVSDLGYEKIAEVAAR